MLDGLVAGRPLLSILANLTGHVQSKLEPLTKALAATLDPLALLMLQMQVEAATPAHAPRWCMWSASGSKDPRRVCFARNGTVNLTSPGQNEAS